MFKEPKTGRQPKAPRKKGGVALETVCTGPDDNSPDRTEHKLIRAQEQEGIIITGG